MTVLFCDLVGSTELAARIDPEEMCQVMSSYQEICGEAIALFGGYIAQTLGDGLLVYFGYPEAHEDDGRRAVGAGLAIVAAIADSALRQSYPTCAVRVGIHTGLVVAGELGRWDTRADMALVGDTPNVAARLEQLAGPNQVLIGPKTQRLVEGHFDLHPLGPTQIKGLKEPMPVWEVRRASSPYARMRPLMRPRSAPLVGREAELAILHERWRTACRGSGQIVVLSGAAGIGKSRLAEALYASVEADQPAKIHYHCSQYFQNSALHPIVEQLAHAADIRTDDPAPHKLEKLERFVAQSSERTEHDTALLARLLQIPTLAGATVLARSPQRLLDDTVEVLITQLVRLAQRAPLMILLEDAHWIDPTSLGFLRRLWKRLPGIRLLILVTHRTRFSQAWSHSENVTTLTLERLPPEHCRTIVRHLTARSELPSRVTEEIVARSDGLPFFVEELTKAVLESETKDAPLCVPSSLQDSLTARLDRIGPLKLVAQLGACIGRSFSYALLNQISSLGEPQLQKGLERLVAAELLTRHGEFPDAQFSFCHALLQNAAYESMLRSERRLVHAAIAHNLEAHQPDVCDHEPEVLAQHLTAAGEHDSALRYWLHAVKRAQQRSAHAEALAHANAGLRSLNQLPHSASVDTREIEFQSALARSHMAGEGWSGRRVHDAYSRALALCRATGDPRKECEVLWGLWADHAVRGELSDARARAADYVALAEHERDRTALLMADSAALITHFCLGEFAVAQRHADRIHANYRPELDTGLVHVFNHDPQVIAFMYEGFWRWVQGEPDRAAEASSAAVARARELNHPFQLCYALVNGSGAFIWRGEDARVLAQIEEGLKLAAECRIPLFQAYGPLMGTAALVERDSSRSTFQWLRRCLDRMRAFQAAMHLPFYQVQLATAYERIGDIKEATTLVQQALTSIEVTGELWIEPELYRAKARLIRHEPGATPEHSEQWLRRGLERATTLGAPGFGLRLSCDLADLLAGDGRTQEARELLSRACEGFSQGEGTRDLRHAREQLARLSPAPPNGAT